MSAVDFLRPTGKNAGPYGNANMHAAADKIILQSFLAANDKGDIPCLNRDADMNFYVGIFYGRTTYMVVSAYNLGLDEKTNEHRGYFILNHRGVSQLETALRVCADFTKEIKEKNFAIFRHYPFEFYGKGILPDDFLNA